MQLRQGRFNTLAPTAIPWGLFIGVKNMEDRYVPIAGIQATSRDSNAIKIRKANKDGAGDGNRTHASSLGSYSSTIELHPRRGVILLRSATPVQRVRRPAESISGPIARPFLWALARERGEGKD